MTTRWWLVLLGLACVWTLSACTQPAQKRASFLRAIANAEYPIELISTGRAHLKNGVFEEAVAPGSASKIKIQLGKELAVGDVSGDNAKDAAVTLGVDPGGSGTFTVLAAVVNNQGDAKPVASVLLGDRIIVKSLAIQSGNIVVIMLTRRPNEPMSAEPTLEVKRTFRLQGSKLVEGD